MLRLILLLLLVVFVVRAIWRVLDGMLDGMREERGVDAASRKPSHSVQMERDPVCGTFVVPERAVTLFAGGRQWHFCSARCRDTFSARTVSTQGRSA